MAPELSNDSLHAALAHRRAQVAQGGALRASSELTGDNSEMASNTLPLVQNKGKKSVANNVADLEITSYANPPL